MIKISNLMRAALTVTLMALAGGCAAVSSKGNETMMVSVKGVNYSGDVVVFSVDDPLVPKNATGGDRASSYSGAGIQCCIQLPKVWHSGMQLVIDAIVYPVDETDFKHELPRYMKKFTVDVPQYPADQPTELWVIRTPSGDMNLVASNVDPTHEAWPGALKGWPEPSLAFKRRYWDNKVREIGEEIERTKSFLEQGLAKPELRLIEWNLRKKNRPNELTKFSGPDDPAFAESITARRKESLSHLQTKLQQLLEERP